MRNRLATSLLFSLFLNLQNLFEWWWWGSMSPFLLSDWDEAYYFPLMQRYGDELLQSLAARDFQSIKHLIGVLLTGVPHFLLGVIAYLPSVLLNIPVATFGLSADVLFATLSFFLLSSLFENITQSRFIAFFASVIALKFPYLLAELPDISPPLDRFGIVSVAHHGFPSIPILRGPFTQLSYPFFLLTLLFTVRCLKVKRFTHVAALLAGTFAAMSIYAYFFAWLTLVILTPVYLFLHRSNSFRELLRSQIAPFGVAATALALPALYGILVGYTPLIEPHSVEVPMRAFFFSCTDILFIVFLSLMLHRDSNPLMRPLVLALFITKFFAMNLQGILGVYLLPYHVPLFYSDSILLGLASILLLERFSNPAWRNSLAFSVIALFVASVVRDSCDTIAPLDVRRVEMDTLEAIKSVVPAQSVIAAYPYQSLEVVDVDELLQIGTSFGWIEPITGRRLLLTLPIPSPYAAVEKELLFSWIFKNKLALMAPPEQAPPILPGDIISGVYTKFKYERYEVLLHFGDRIASENLCNLLSRYRFDFVYWKTREISPETLTRRDFFEHRWTSSDGERHLIEFDYAGAVREHCAPTLDLERIAEATHPY